MKHVLAALLMTTFPAHGDAEPNTLALEPRWEFVADTVMGGVSTGQVTLVTDDGRAAARLSGTVSLENNGGFVQMAFDVSGGTVFDASSYDGIEIVVRGNGETYDLRLRTDQITRPWQSFRTDFIASDQWDTLRFPFTSFVAHKTDASFDPARLRRIGVLGIGRAFDADVSVAAVRFYRTTP